MLFQPHRDAVGIIQLLVVLHSLRNNCPLQVCSSQFTPAQVTFNITLFLHKAMFCLLSFLNVTFRCGHIRTHLNVDDSKYGKTCRSSVYSTSPVHIVPLHTQKVFHGTNHC